MWAKCARSTASRRSSRSWREEAGIRRAEHPNEVVSNSGARPMSDDIRQSWQRYRADAQCDAAERENQRNIRKAARTGTCCAKCTRQLAPDEPVWRQNLSLGRGLFGGWRCSVAPVCEQCRSDWREFRGSRPCENCGRLVHNEYNRRSYIRTFCSTMCQSRWSSERQSALAREQRRQARGVTKECASCGEHFEPTRADARYCSTACRMRAHRHRVTTSKRETRIAF
jgi:hypothetical protein